MGLAKFNLEVFPSGILKALYCGKFGDFGLQILKPVVLALLTFLVSNLLIFVVWETVMMSYDVPKYIGPGIHRGLVPGPQQIPKSSDAQVPYVNGVVFVYNLHTSSSIL